MGKSAAFWSGFLAGEEDAAAVAVAAVAEGRGSGEVCRAEARKGRGGAIAPAGAVGTRQEQIVGRGEEILAADHREGGLIDLQIGHVGALRPVGTQIAGGVAEFMGHQHPQGAIAVIGDTDPIGDAIEAIAVVTKFTRINHFAEHRTPLRSHQERLGRQGGFWNDLLLGIGLSGGHHTELAQLHLAGGGANTLVDLISDQEIAKLAGVVAADASEVAADINDAGGFLVIGDEVGVRGARAPEQDRIVLRQLHQRVGGGVVTPDLRQAGVAAGIFLQQDRAVIGHGHVVEHHLALAAVEQHLHRTAELRTGGVRELQRPQPAGACGRGRGDEIEALAVLAPGPIFRPQPVGHTGGNALAVQRGAGFTLDITQIHQLKAADAAAIQSQARFIRARQVAQLGVGGASGVDANAIGGATG